MSNPELPGEIPQPPGMQDLIQPDVLKRAGLDNPITLARAAEGISLTFNIGSVVDKDTRVVVVEERGGEDPSAQRWRVSTISEAVLQDEERLESEIDRLCSGFAVDSGQVGELVRLLGPRPPRKPGGGS
jgi:hypothetical protein